MSQTVFQRLLGLISIAYLRPPGQLAIRTNHKTSLSRAFCTALLFILAGCGSSRDSTPVAQSPNGAANLNGVSTVGQTLTASVNDPDGVRAGTETYQWFANGQQITGAAASTYMLTPNEGGDAVTVVVRYTDNGGLRETVESAALTVQSAFTLGATFIHGPVDGAMCELVAVDATGMATTELLGSGTTNNGSVNFGSLIPFDGTALITCSGGTYISEATGLIVNAPITRAVVTVDGDTTFTVSPLTEIATQLAVAVSDLNTAVSTHNAAMATRVGITGDITEIEPTDLTSSSAQDDDAGKYAVALALIAQLDADDPATSTADLLTMLSDDLADDGTLTQPNLDAFNTAVGNLAAAPVAGNLDDTALAVVQSAINNEPEAAIFDNLSSTIPNDQVTALTGSISITDANFGEDALSPLTDFQTTYGTINIAANGDWTYALNTEDETVAGLQVGGSVSDMIAISSVDGTPAILVIRITALTQVAQISNTINGDTGELRLNLEEHQLQGKVSFSFLKTEALADDGNQKDAYITLYGSSGSSSESLVDLRIQGSATEEDGITREPRFLVRNTEADAYPGDPIIAPFTENIWYEVEIMWDLSQANQITILINGEVLGGGAFSTAAVVDSDFIDLNQWFSEGVERIQWRFGDNGTVIPFGSYLVDNIAIYSDTAGTALVFEDDFEANNIGDLLAGSMTYPDSVDAVVAEFDAGAQSQGVPAAFFNLVGAINSDNSELLMGSVTIIDPDMGENMFVEQPGTTTEYGAFSIDASGAWEYVLNTMDPTITALVQGDRLTETIPLASIDGTSAELVITINGVGGAATGANNVAVIIDTNPGDTGELRYALGENGPLAAGRLEARVMRVDDDLGNGDAFITLFNENTNNDGAILDFRIRDNSFAVRSPSNIDTSALSVVLDTFMDVVITWAYPAGDTTMLPEVTITVDGVSLDPFTPDNNALGGVTHIAFRFGDNGGVREDTGRLTIDDVAIYSDTAGTTEVFADDFESYLNGDSLDTDNAASPYNSSTSEATVETVGGPNNVAVVIDTDPGDTGELRYALGENGPLAAGRLEAKVMRLDDDLGNGDAFITLFNENTNNDGAILDFRIRDNSFAVRSPSSIDTSALTVVLDTFMDVVITWAYPGGDTMMLPEVTITVDGVSLDPFTTDNNALGGVTHVAFRFGDNGGVREDTGKFTIDDLAIFSDVQGSTEVFADDFESYLEGDSLDTDNAASPYNGSTSEATIETIGGPSGPGTSGNQLAEIRDTDAGDTGELRYALGENGPLAAGRLEAHVKRLDDDLGNGDAFITLFNENTNNDGAILDFRIRDNSFAVRSPSSIDTSALSVVLDTFMAVVVTWEYPAGDTTMLPEVTITVDGISLDPFTPENNSTGGVTHIAFRFGDNGGVREATGIFSVDDLKIYSDTTGSTEVFSDDFESYLVGDSLDTDNAASPYNSSTSEATVGVEE